MTDTGYLTVADQLPLFFRPAWLDAVAGAGEWDAWIVADGAGTIRGVWPYVREQRWGIPLIRQPRLTPFLGPWLFYPTEQTLAQRQEWERKTLQELIRQLPTAPWYIQSKAHYQLTNWQPFHWAGFRQTTFYSYVLPDISDPQALWANIASTTRNDIRGAQAVLSVTADAPDALTVFSRLTRLTFLRKKQTPPYDEAFLTRAVEAARLSGGALLLTALDDEQRPHAAALLVWDHASAYLLGLASDPKIRHRGALALLIWEGIQRCAAHVPVFDFEGSMLPGPARTFASFGGQPQPTLVLQKWKWRWLEALWALRR